MKGKSILKINKVLHAFRKMFPDKTNAGQESTMGINCSCYLDVSCHSAWADETQGVVRFLSNSGNNPRKFSASLINNTLRDKTPYLITADHAIQDQDADRKLPLDQFQFFFKTVSCNSNTIGSIVTYTGADVLVRHPDTDLALIKLKQNLNHNSRCYAFLGWNRSTSNPSSITSVQFLSSALCPTKMYVTFGGAGTKFYTPDTERHVWQVTAPHGWVGGGGSGGPAFDQNQRIIGTVHGGASGEPDDVNCIDNTVFYGRLEKAWNGTNFPGRNGDQHYGNFKQFLDNNNSGASSLTTFIDIPLHALILAENSSFPHDQLCGDRQNFITASYGGTTPIIEYAWQAPPGWLLQIPTPPNDKSVAIITPPSTAIFGDVRVRARSSCGWSSWIPFRFFVQRCGGFLSAFPNPSDQKLDIVIGDGSTAETNQMLKNEIEIKVFNNNQDQIIGLKTKSRTTTIDTSVLPKGMYFLHVVSKENVHRQQIIIE